MTTYTPFTPQPNVPFSFTPTLDGKQYGVVIKWNMSRRDWYFNLSTLTGSLILSRALTSGSPVGYDINLVAGYFASTCVYREGTNQFEVSP
jgi:hypothetical protein